MGNKLSSDMIAEGIDKSIFGQVFKGFIYVTITFLIIFTLVGSYFYYTEWKWEKEMCGDGGCPQAVIQTIDPCLKAIGTRTLICEVYNTKNESEGVIYYGLCGYQEANAWFEQIKNDYGEENAKIECSQL